MNNLGASPVISKEITFANSQSDAASQEAKDQRTSLAGFICEGKYAWCANGSTLKITSASTGFKVAYHNFATAESNASITCVEEISYASEVCLLAVALEFTGNLVGTGMLSIFCVQGSKILGSMDIPEVITCCKYIDKQACRKSVLNCYSGAIAIGTDQGKIFIIDLMLPKQCKVLGVSPMQDHLSPLINVPAEMDSLQISLLHQKTLANREKGKNYYFAIQLKKVFEECGAILSMLVMPNLFMMAVGLDDGRMILYDLLELNAFHLAYPPGNRAPLTQFSFIEPIDDPRCVVYVWAFHVSQNDGAIAVMHSIMFENKVDCCYENFVSCSVRLTMPMYEKNTFPVCCRSVTKSINQEEDEFISISMLAWSNESKKKTRVMIFDLNQWYKEQMPDIGDWRNDLKYVVTFEIDNISSDVICDEKSILPFNSIMRPEEHFYPNSLSLNVASMTDEKITYYHWTGIQNVVLRKFNAVGPQIILEPNKYFHELLQVAISPQFYDVNFNSATPIELKREFLLSVALDYNYVEFLKKCAWSWADGSYLGKDGSNGIGLSTLTDWIWNRARIIKDICNSQCTPLFDFSEQRIDCGTQKQLSLCCKQLKVLSDLLQVILKGNQKFIPQDIFTQLQTQSETIRAASDYQEVLQWLLNVGLLPEGNHNYLIEYDGNESFVVVPYPYHTIKAHYEKQRLKLQQAHLFIDDFIEHECEGEKLVKVWKGNYPPNSIQALLRTLLVPNISITNKYVIFVYLFMDITNVLNDTPYASIVRNLIKFPAVFNMNSAMIKRTQAFWNLDNGNLDTAVDELISSISNVILFPKWQRELIISSLLKQNANNLALRALRCLGDPVSAELEVLTLLANNLLGEALKVQRANGSRSLLETFYDKIFHSPYYEQLLDLSLTEEEGKVLRDYLQKNELPKSVNLCFVYLLKRSKFLDAVELVESLGEKSINLEPHKQVLNAYYSTMDSTTRKFISVVHTKDVQGNDSSVPMSANLIQSRCNAKNNFFQKCMESIANVNNEVTAEINEMPFVGTPKMGIFEYKQPTNFGENIYSSLEINEHGKRQRSLDNNNGIFKLDDFEEPQNKRRKLDSIGRKSFMDKRINTLTQFKETKPKLNFSQFTPHSSSRNTPEKMPIFGDLLATPIIEKKTPSKTIMRESGAATPQSILKTRSCRSSVSPAHSRLSEFDDNKSVKSITFAALPDTRESSINDSSYLEESFSEQITSGELHSPEKSTQDETMKTSVSNLSGPKPRRPLKSRSNSPPDEQTGNISENIEREEQQVNDEANEESLLEPLPSNESENNEMYFKNMRKSILRDNFADGSSGSESNEEEQPSIYDYGRKSILQDDFAKINTDTEKESDASENEGVYHRNPILGSSSEDSSEDIPMDEHFEEEELPEHSDDDLEEDSDSGTEEYPYGDIEIDDSSSSEAESEPKSPKKTDEIICLDSSSESNDVQIQNKVAPAVYTHISEEQNQLELDSPQIENISSPEKLDRLPSFDKIEQAQNEDQNTDLYQLVSADNIVEQPAVEDENIMVEFVSEPVVDEVQNIESPPYESNLPTTSNSDLDLVQNVKEIPSEENILARDSGDAEIAEKEIFEQENMQIVATQEQLELVEKQNVSEMSEEISFMSACGGELDEGIIVSNATDIVPENISTEKLVNDTTDNNNKTTEMPFTSENESEHAGNLLDCALIEDTKVSENENLDMPTTSDNLSEFNENMNTASENLNESDHVEKTLDCALIEDTKAPENENLDAPTTSESLHESSENMNTASENLNESDQVVKTLDWALIEDTKVSEIENINMPTTSESLHESSENMNTASENLNESDQVVKTLDCALIEDTKVSEIENINMPTTSESLQESNENMNTASENMNERDHVEKTFDCALIEDSKAPENENIDTLMGEASEITENPLNYAIANETELKTNDNESLDISSTTDYVQSQSSVENTPNPSQESEGAKSNVALKSLDVTPNEEDIEIEKILQNALDNDEGEIKSAVQDTPMDLRTPKKRSQRAQSLVIERTSIAANSGTSSPRSRSSRASSEARSNPKAILKERMLEKIEESPLVLSPGVMTRYKSKLLLESRETTPVSTPTKGSREPSIESDIIRKSGRQSAGTPTTPRRLTRAASRESVGIESLQSVEAHEQMPKKRRGRQRNDTTTTDEDDLKSNKSNKSTRSNSSRKKGTPSSRSKLSPPEKLSPVDELSVSNRRLTRSQLSVLEKSRQLAEKMAESSLRATKSDMGSYLTSVDSDDETTKSEKSYSSSQASSKTPRKRKLPKKFEDFEDVGETATKTSRKDAAKGKHQLSIIPEESQDVSKI